MNAKHARKRLYTSVGLETWHLAWVALWLGLTALGLLLSVFHIINT
jgi:hypothetical protein